MKRALLVVVVGLVFGLTSKTSTQSLAYNSGQDVSPAYEGWEENADGSFNLLFGYMNRNWQEEIDVPVGPENNLEPGGPDQGQPTHLQPRRNRFVFRVRVPKDFGQKELIWTLTTKGKTNKAYASLKTDLRIENIDIMSETGALGAGTSSPEVRANQPPAVKIEGEKKLTARVGQPLTFSAIVADDGVPRRRGFGVVRSGTGAGDGVPTNPALTPPSRVTVGKVVGLHASWFVYRGAGKVTFTPDQIEVWEDTRTGANSPWGPGWVPPQAPAEGRWKAQATFSEPGTYVIRCLADDGGLMGTEDLTVTVTH